MKHRWSVIAIALLVLINSVPALAQTQVQLPPLTGDYAVGRVSYDFADSARQDPFVTASKESREVAVKIYYPAEGTQKDASTPYAEGLEVDALALALHYPINVIQTDLHAHAVTDAPLSNAVTTYPVVLFTGDIGSTALYYTGLLEDLASHGYIVVALSHPYSNTFTVLSDGRVAFPVTSGSADTAKAAAGRDQIGAVWTSDVGFVFAQLGKLSSDDKRFAGHLDLAHTAIIGHGFGGAVALSVAASDSRFVGGVSLDGRVFGDTASKTLNSPVMFIDPASASLRPADETTALEQIKAKSTSILYNIQVTNSIGSTFATDLDTLNGVFATPIKADASTAAASSPASIIQAYIEAFLDKHLKGEDVPLLDSAANAQSGVQVEIVSP